MSVVECECAERSSGLICKHAKRFYAEDNIVGEPIMFFLIEREEIPEGGNLKQSRSTSGDDCHHDVEGVSDKRLKTAFKGKNWAAIQVCEGDKPRPFNEADAAALSAKSA